MIKFKAASFENDFEYDNAKRQARKEARQRRDVRKGKRTVWKEKE